MKSTWTCPPEPDTDTVHYVPDEGHDRVTFHREEDGRWHMVDDDTVGGRWATVVSAAAMAGGTLEWEDNA